MRLLKSHPRSILFLLLYLCWWAWAAYRITTVTSVDPEVKMASFIVIIGTISISGIYILMLIYKIFTTKQQQQTDYCIFLAVVSMPVLIGLIYMVSKA